MKTCTKRIMIFAMLISAAANIAVVKSGKSYAIPNNDANILLTQTKLPSGRDDFALSIWAHSNGTATALFNKYDETLDSGTNSPIRLIRQWNIGSNAFERITNNMLFHLKHEKPVYTSASTNYAYKMDICLNNARNSVTNTLIGVSGKSIEKLYTDSWYEVDENGKIFEDSEIHSTITGLMYGFPSASMEYDVDWHANEKELVDYYGGTRNLAWWHKTSWFRDGTNSPPPAPPLQFPERVAATNLFSRAVPETGAVLRMSERVLFDGWSRTSVWFNENLGFGEGLVLIQGYGKDDFSSPKVKCQWFFERQIWDDLTNRCFGANASMYLDGFDAWSLLGGSARITFNADSEDRSMELKFYDHRSSASAFERLPQIMYDFYEIIPLREFDTFNSPVWNMKSTAGTLVRYLEEKRDRDRSWGPAFDMYDLYLSPKFYELERENQNRASSEKHLGQDLENTVMEPVK